ncbi:hypothetical protein [Enterococcus saccharolyticus]|uniref:Uncharacterized protein n=1 Tax=Enterococcus saccharolyticus subsp. saccharolyticus ATCC 43076 TaxID=1139996 RepID=S0J8G4_9ENTE|nr:hypothetical protein [Enterococcus saccharolyticus]EOT29214.1 hypothetical protein OMQ_01166 [Enterococcus saccharolyticus subsp. saccharolyticus ATCC 43076]EOT81013.1 hypothetical protein I572_01545 [Enterococcus saccharolyticus subsp. saccharolyticus ATCC 43076]OJG85845.1 hypothetical protein RV16_GL001289 [Enterococcus saccharolyticus]
MYSIKGKQAARIEPVTFSELNMTENDIEEILRNSIDMICDEEESMLIVGRQVRNEKNGRSDLTAVDNSGNIVLIEIKRDRKDIEHRREAFEFQAIRYAASYATIEKTDDLVKKVYAPYIEKYRSEFELGELTSFELGIRKLNEFLQVNDAQKNFNEKQRIILVASDFDEQTLSAVAWLNSNNVDMSCYRLTPYKLNEDLFFYVEKLLPVTNYDDYYVNLMDKSLIATASGEKKIIRRSLPKIDLMLEWGVVKEGDIIVAKGREDEGRLLSNGNVMVNGEEKSMQAWLKEIYGWSSVQTYVFAVHKETGKTLSQIREEYIG